MRKLAPARVSYRNDFLISYRAYMTSGSFHISLLEGTLHVEIQNRTHYACATLPVYRQTDFTSRPKPASARVENESLGWIKEHAL